jgi:hypothetical protein
MFPRVSKKYNSSKTPVPHDGKISLPRDERYPRQKMTTDMGMPSPANMGITPSTPEQRAYSMRRQLLRNVTNPVDKINDFTNGGLDAVSKPLNAIANSGSSMINNASSMINNANSSITDGMNNANQQLIGGVKKIRNKVDSLKGLFGLNMMNGGQ